jgi:hypothetical protein
MDAHTEQIERPVRPASLRRLSAALNSDAVLYLGLLVLVWGLTVPLRGLWQDDTMLLGLARRFQGHGLAPVTPTRRLYTLPFHLALATPQPIWTLHAFLGLVWLGEALVAGWLVRLLLPGQRLTRFLTICLTLTATSDYLTNNLTGLGYNLAAFTLLLAIAWGMRYLDEGQVRWLVPSCAVIAFSIWTLDLAIPALPFVPLLFFWRSGLKSWRRVLLFGLAWALALAPAALAEWRFLHDPSSYAAVAIRPMSLMARVSRTASFWLENFAPWRWAFARHSWYPRPAAIISGWAMGLAAALAAAWFAFRARQVPSAERSLGAVPTLSLVALFAGMALTANAAYASIQMAELQFRTHILSRIWASLALAILVGWAAEEWPRLRAVFLLVPTLFVGLGVWGGLERQDLWAATWRLHHKELLSIVTNAPAFTPGTGLILRSESTPYLYLATEADYLAQNWLILLYDDPSIHALRLAPDRGTGCRGTPQGLECWHEQKADCFAAGTCPADRFPYESLVLMDFDDQAGVYRLRSHLQGDRLLEGSGVTPAGYRPFERILQRPLTPRQRALLME